MEFDNNVSAVPFSFSVEEEFPAFLTDVVAFTEPVFVPGVRVP